MSSRGYAYYLMGNRTRLIEADATVTLYEHDGVYRLNRVTENKQPFVGYREPSVCS